MKKLYEKIVRILSTQLSFWAVWFFTTVQAIWIAVSARYPMAFDEAYHFNIIKLHTRQWGPFFMEQPPGPATYGALTRDPSYLHHWLLSFPYRLLDSLGMSEYGIIVSLRLLNVAMYAAGLYLFWKLLQKTKASLAAINAAVFFFVMIPTVPLLAGHINYDNLQFPMFALAMIYTVNFAAKLKQNKFDISSLVGAVTISLLGSVNKFTFLPVLTAIVAYLAFVVARAWRSNKKQLKRTFSRDFKAMSKIKTYLLALLIAVSSIFFLWTYAVNIAVYKNPTAQCHQVLNPERCQTYGPWARNYRLAQENQQEEFHPNLLKFNLDWLGGMHYRLFFTINGATGKKLYENHTAPMITGAAGLLALSGTVLFLRYGRRILRNDPAFIFMLFTAAVYFIAVWGRNYNDYLHLGQMVAVNGRYLQPLLLPVILVLIASFQWAFRLMPGVKLVIFGLSSILFLSGGGISGFIHYSDTNWYFVNRPNVLWLNEIGKRLVAPFFLWRGGGQL